MTTKQSVQDMEDLYKPKIIKKNMTPTSKTIEFLKDLSIKTDNNTDIDKLLMTLRKQHRHHPNKTQLSSAYWFLLDKKEIDPNENVRQYIKAKEMRGLSGVIVISTITSPYPEYIVDGKKKIQRFSCKHDCHYCPREVDENGREVNARSYLSDEPTVARGLRLNYDPILQFNDRANQYKKNGHHVDKIEIIVLGGTWTEYPRQYQETYIRDIFYAANMFYSTQDRESKSLTEEQRINETAASRIIGLTLEMRPDSINQDEIKWLRYLGCTRVQLGVQHIDDTIMKNLNRGCYIADAKNALKLLKQHGYKVDAHWMPDLPGSSPEKDKEMFDEILKSEDLQFDQWKIYPTAVVPWTRIKKWHEDGTYVPYTDVDPKKLIDVLIDVKSKVPEWIRLNRVVRDIPNFTMDGKQYIYGGNKVTNLRQIIENEMKKQNKFCSCIRCREVKNNNKMLDYAQKIIRMYNSSNGLEYFISIESGNSVHSSWNSSTQSWNGKNGVEPGIIFGFIRLRINNNNTDNKYFPELNSAAFIRELHVYGQVTGNRNENSNSQHKGVGSALLRSAEHIARQHSNTLAIISGIGVKNFYRARGYSEQNTYMVKNLEKDCYKTMKYYISAIFFMILGFLFLIL